jgi:hypothetical protein
MRGEIPNFQKGEVTKNLYRHVENLSDTLHFEQMAEVIRGLHLTLLDF